MNNLKIEEIRVYLSEKLPSGYLLLVAPPEKEKTLFGVLEYNPQKWVLIDLVLALIKRVGNWHGGGSLN